MPFPFINKTLVCSFVLLVIPLTLTFYAWKLTAENLHEVNQAKFETLARESEKALLYRMDSYKQALLGGKGFFEGSNNVERSEWEAYVAAIGILENFPGMNGIGAIYDVPREGLDEFVEEARKDGYPDFTIHPEGEYPGYFIIKYIEPVEINVAAVGLNIGFEANRYEAATKARNTGHAAITKKILLVQDAEKTPGFLLLLPTYDSQLPTTTAQERQYAFQGWIYAAFIAKNFMHDLTGSQGETINLQVYDGNKTSKDALIFDSNLNGKSTEAAFVIEKTVEVMQQKWTLVWTSTKAFERLEQSNEPLLVLLVGLMFTGSFAVFLIVITIRSSKEDELLAKNFIIPAGAFLIALLAAFYLQKEVAQKEVSFIANATQKEAEAIKEIIVSNVESRILALDRMAERWSVRGGTPWEEWQSDAEKYVLDQPGLKTVEWVDNKYKVRWVEPLVGNESIVGLDILYDEERTRALKGAKERNHATLTPPLDLKQGYKAFISYSPIYINEVWDGFIAGIFGIEELIASSLPYTHEGNFALHLSESGEVFYKTIDMPLPPQSEWISTQTISLYDKEWQITVFPTQQFIKENRSFLPDLILAIGIILAVMIMLIINFAQRTKQKTALVTEKENLLSRFVKHTPAAVAMFDDNMRYVVASDRWYKDYGLEGQDIIGKSHYDIFPEIPKSHPHWLDVHQRAINGEIIKVDEEAFTREDGCREWLRYELHPWHKDYGESRGLIMFTEIITERKQMETMKDEFISTVNHELRTPLTSIQGSLGLLKAKAANDLDEKGKRLLELSYDNCERLTHLVNDILDMEKIAAGKMVYHFETLEICSLVNEIVTRNQSYADKYHIHFHVHTKEKEVYCHIDKSRFEQALVNLLSNAAKFSPEGEAVNIFIIRTDEKHVKISVEDSGPGIPANFRKKIFGKFAQADSSSTRSKGGTGLGLNITKTIIEAFGGEINFRSEQNKGTQFYFILPICNLEEKPE